jgi:hypothetical protein
MHTTQQLQAKYKNFSFFKKNFSLGTTYNTTYVVVNAVTEGLAPGYYFEGVK